MAEECYGCQRLIVDRLEHGTHFTRQDTHRAFRCLICGRLFCPVCAEVHFGLESKNRIYDNDDG